MTTPAWKERFRAEVIARTQVAAAAPGRGLVVSNRSGIYQLHAWDVPTGALRQLTHRPHGTLSGVISPDGRYVYYLDDRQGSEQGHYVRVPFEGGREHDITPGMPHYRSWDLTLSRSGRHAAFTFGSREGHRLCRLDLGAKGLPARPRQ